MEHAKKMALVPQELLETVQSQSNQMTNPVTKMLSSLDREMQLVLERTDIPNDEKAKLYQQTLQQYRAYSDKRKEPVKISIIPSANTSSSDNTLHLDSEGQDKLVGSTTSMDGVENDVMESVPKSLQKKAKLLLSKMKQHEEVDWNDKGELMFHGKPLTGTHMVDLVNDVLRRRKTFTPRGWQQFAQVLSVMNVPQDLIGNKDRWNWMQSLKGMQPSDHTDSDDISGAEALEKPVKPKHTVSRKRKLSAVISTSMKPRHRSKNWINF